MATGEDDPGSAATIVGATGPIPAPSSANAAAPPNVIAERYEILALLGVGGMGRVYRAHDRKLDEVVALKLVRAELLGTEGTLDRFRQEVKLARRVTSPHVVRTFDLGEHGDEHFLTMEYIDGRSLRQLLDDGPLAIDEVLRIARAAAAGIAAAHAGGVLHRDLKPDNILVAKTGRIAITDFGVATASATPIATLERFAGTPAYMSPEQVESGALQPASDVYAVGAILFEMLTGRRPFVGSDPIAVAIARLREPPPDPRTLRDVPSPLADIVVRCLAREPGERFVDGAALAIALDSLHDLTAPGPAAFQPRATTPAKTSRTVAILPLRAPGELADVADGLAEEIVDALSMTRALRVRPLASVRKPASADTDSRAVGHALGVDVVVDGSIRRRGEQVRIAARVIGVADGFQLWASHFDARPEALLAASDEVVRAIARALTVELELPSRPTADPRASELYLESKAKLRARWLESSFTDVVTDLERAQQLAPDDPAILATLALALARTSFGGMADRLAEARRLAARAVALAPTSGEALAAAGIAAWYDNDVPAAAEALLRSVMHSPGIALAQAALGAILLEADLVDYAILHLEAAKSLDPDASRSIDLPRAYIYAGRWDEGMRELEDVMRSTPSSHPFQMTNLARFKMWRGERWEPPGLALDHLPVYFAPFYEAVRRFHRTHTIPPEDREALLATTNVPNARLRATRSQLVAELAAKAGDHALAIELARASVERGLEDYAWFQHCPVIAPLREHAEFAALAARVGERAARVGAAVREALRGEGRA